MIFIQKICCTVKPVYLMSMNKIYILSIVFTLSDLFNFYLFKSLYNLTIKLSGMTHKTYSTNFFTNVLILKERTKQEA